MSIAEQSCCIGCWICWTLKSKSLPEGRTNVGTVKDAHTGLWSEVPIVSSDTALNRRANKWDR